MGLQISYTDRFGRTNPAAYCRIVEEWLDQGNSMATIRVGVWVDEAARRAGKDPLDTFTLRAIGPAYTGKFDDAGLKIRTPMQRGYDFAKTQAPFLGGTDV